MNILPFCAILAVIIGVSQSFRLDSVVEKINEDRIINGETAKPGQFPYQAALRALQERNGTKWFSHNCGGSIISNQWVLSAAHCTERFKPDHSNLAIAVGAHHVQNDGQMYHVERIVNHPEFNESSHFADISLLQTESSIQFTDVVHSISLRRQFVDEDAVATLSGWGWIRVRRKFCSFCPLCR